MRIKYNRHMPKGAKIALVLSAIAVALSGCQVETKTKTDKEGGGFDISFGANNLDKGEPITEADTTLTNFTELVVAGPDAVVVQKGDTASIRAEGDAKTVAGLRYIFDGDDLVVGRKKGTPGRPIKIIITVPSLSDVTLAGSGAVQVAELSGDSVEWTIAGKGDLNIAAVNAKSMEGTIAGSGDAILTAGTVDEADITIAGAGNINAKGVTVRKADVSIVGSGNIAMNVTESVDANIVGSGNVTVTGGAQCTVSKTGSGTVNCGE